MWPWETIKDSIWWDSKDSKANQCTSNHLEPHNLWSSTIGKYCAARYQQNQNFLSATDFKIVKLLLLLFHTSTIIKLEKLEGRKLILLQIFIFCYCCSSSVFPIAAATDEMKTRVVDEWILHGKTNQLASFHYRLCASKSKKKDWGADECRGLKSSWIISLTTLMWPTG